MDYQSTRGQSRPVNLSEAVRLGLAGDGGLFVPGVFPSFEVADFAGAEGLAAVGQILLTPFFSGDPLAAELAAICDDAFNFPTPVKPVAAKPGLAVLELFHGPTAAFKDVGARFLAACLERIEQRMTEPLKVLVATSGDTGGAVAAAFHGRPGIEVYVLYPAGMVSPRQEQQLTCWGDNVHAFRVAGVFDDCQQLVKQAFGTPDLRAARRLTSANSISIGRLLPQAVYYAATALAHWREHGQAPSFIIPTGNLGNAVAAVWARHMGLPVDHVYLATNANRVIPDYLRSGQWQPRQSLVTLASAMDVGNPSNMERLRHLYTGKDIARQKIDAWAVSDEQIAQQIVCDYRDNKSLWCPHTATAAFVYDHYVPKVPDCAHIMVATAHPAKFETVIEPLIGETILVPPSLERLMHLPSRYVEIEPDFAAFVEILSGA
ncbi:MAG: threonine synthase [Gammaproteobacteria bacterium]|nr:threonine synthase [Gammaproteobacteria bacterium]